MKVYLYLDIYILLNFIMNLFLLIITAIIRQKQCRVFRLFLTSFAVALLSAAITYFWWGNTGWLLLFTILQLCGLNFFAFSYEGYKSFLSDCVTFVFLTFFAGGCIGAFVHLLDAKNNSAKRYSLWWILIAVIVLFILFFVFRWELLQQQSNRETVLSVTIVHKGSEYHTRALYDTGNQLLSPYTGEKVSVISEKLSEKIGIAKEQNPVYIPYSSVGGSGLMKAYRLESIWLSGGKRQENVLVAVSENLNAENEVQMILNII